jgi:hypothetical protein
VRKVVGSKFSVRFAIFDDVVGDHEDGMSNGDDCFLMSFPLCWRSSRSIYRFRAKVWAKSSSSTRSRE